MNSLLFEPSVIRFEKEFGKGCAVKSVRTPPECRTLRVVSTRALHARGVRTDALWTRDACVPSEAYFR